MRCISLLLLNKTFKVDNMKILTEDKSLHLEVYATKCKGVESGGYVTFEVRLNQMAGVLKRLWYGIRYVFGYKSKFNSYVEIEVCKVHSLALDACYKEAGIYDSSVVAPDILERDMVLYVCDCFDPAHNMILGKWDDVAYLEFHLVAPGLEQRIRNAINYILKPSLDICFFDGVVLGNNDLSKKKANELSRILETLKEQSNEPS